MSPPGPKDAIYALAEAAYDDFERAARPSHMLGAARFEACVEAMRTSSLTDADLFGFLTGDAIVQSMSAAEALARRRPGREIRDRLLEAINEISSFYVRFFGLRAIVAGTEAGESGLGLVLSALDESWHAPLPRTILGDLVSERIAAGDPPRLEGLRGTPSDATCKLLPSLLGSHPSPAVTGFLAALAELRASRVDLEFLRSIGTLRDSDDDALIVEHHDLVAKRALIAAAIGGTPPRPVLVVGRPGTGRSTLVEAVWRELRGRGWNMVRAGHMELIADQSHVGELEGRMKRFLDELGRSRRTLWVAPEFQTFLFAGRYRNNPTGLIDLLLPAAVDGLFPLVAVTEPSGLDLLSRSKPEILTAFEIVRLEPLPEAESLALAREWDERRPRPPDGLPEALIREASHLAQQYLAEMAAPGSLLGLLEAVCRDLNDAGRTTASVDDLIACVGRLTRLPLDILDDRQVLDLGRLTGFFTARVMGQPEAIETLVERVAMIKAGVTDPTRPLGVFLFAGPTGTGKTELAKTLAEYLFGSPARLVRLDMSELQTPESLARLLGDGQRDQTGDALVDQIRRNPFSVVLLDEFEKADPQIWDLFLQVFDDGRLTDRRGITADFRNCIIILTSNLGSTLPAGPGLGFGGSTRPSTQAVEQAVEQAVARVFRREFFNRIDRVVVFRPLSRDVLREILHKELRDVFRRRGLRNRDWAVVWDETAIDFLLDRGTTPDLGARPLKRAIDQHVLAPLARTIVEHQVPHGDQFLFVRRRGDGLEAEFIDPDAQPAGPPPAASDVQPERLESLALDPWGGPDEVNCLERHLDGLLASIEADDWRERKRTAFERQRDAGFWESPRRFSVFGAIEQMDRIEAGVHSAARLFEKLRGAPAAGRTRLAGEHVGRLAVRLFLLETAVADVHQGRPLDAFVLVEAVDSGEPQRAATAGFFARLVAMYRGWAERRGLKVETVLEEASRGPRLLLAVSGLAAHTLLAPETGLHVLQEPAAGGHGFDRIQVRVRVVAQPEVPPDDEGLRVQALAAFESHAAPFQIVRRYRERPSPLVRDTVRGWRTGRIDRVYAGDFDLFVGVTEAAEAGGRADDA